MALHMSDEDIKKEFLEAKDRKKQVTVLAELNDATEEDIRAALIRAGVPHQQLPRKRKGGTFALATTETAPSGEEVSAVCTEAKATAADQTIQELLSQIAELRRENMALQSQLKTASGLTGDLMSDVEMERSKREEAEGLLRQKAHEFGKLEDELLKYQQALSEKDGLIVKLVTEIYGGAER